MNSSGHRRRANAGFTLIELMIASTLGLFVTGLAVTSFVGHVRSAELGQTLVTLQTQARFALGEITAGVRAAGYLGCAGTANIVPALPVRAGGGGVPRSAWRPVDGFVVSSGAWAPGYPQGYGAGGYTPPGSGPAVPVAGSDALLVEGGVNPGSASAGGLRPDRSIDLLDPVLGLAPGAMALIGNCARAEAFQVERVERRADGTGTVVATGSLLDAYDRDPAFPFALRVMPYRRALYFVGDTGRTSEAGEPVRALYEHLHPFVDTVPAELADGVEAMVVRYRQRLAGGATRELAADDPAFDPALVVGVTVGLLISDAGYRPSADQVPVFRLAGVAVDGDGGSGPAHPDDTRMRRAFERSAVVRSRVDGGAAP